MAIYFNASAPVGWGVDETGHFIKVPSGYVQQGNQFIAPQTTNNTISKESVDAFKAAGGDANSLSYEQLRAIDATTRGTTVGGLNAPTATGGIIGQPNLQMPNGQIISGSSLSPELYREYQQSGGKQIQPTAAAPTSAVFQNLPAGSPAGAYRYDAAKGGWVPNTSGGGTGTGGTGTGGTGTGGTGGTGNTQDVITFADGRTVDVSGWPEDSKAVVRGLQENIATLTKQRKKINPDIQIDDATAQRYLEQAKTELGPWYKQAFAQTDIDLKTSIEREKQAFAQKEQDLSKSFGQDLEKTQQGFADRGLTFSSQRGKAESDLSSAYTQALDRAGTTAAQNIQDTATTGERTLGSANMPSLDTSIRSGTSFNFNTPGSYGATMGTGTKSLFSGTAGTTGTLERAKLFDETTRQKELITNDMSDQERLANPQY